MLSSQVLRQVNYICEPRTITIDIEFPVNSRQLIITLKVNDVIAAMPSGFETKLGENGSLLSGGQRQRISLARAFYHDMDLMIMDESTSALDQATEKEVSDEIMQLKGKKTIIIVSHRRELLKDCDYIYDLDNNNKII